MVFYCLSISLSAETVLSFGDFKKNEITELISNKDPLGLNSDIESYSTIKYHTTKSKEAILPEDDKQDDKTDMEYSAILHYLKAVNFNNRTDTN